MADIDNALERRAKLLASRLTSRKEVLTQALAPKGQRPPFHDQLSKPEALQWWTLHRNDEFGKQVIAQMKPESILELDNALMQHKQGFFNGTQESSGNPI